jgi:energy-coupling factor transporter ATP-binding protein EcfA2
MDIWYKKLGYYENPFLINPLKEVTPLFGQEQQLKNVKYYIKSGSLIFVQAPKGGGKTKLLRTVIDNFRGKIIYVNAAKLKKNLNVEDLLRKKNGFSGKVFGSKPRDMILVLDNVEELSKVNLERIKFYYDQGFLQSVVFTGNNFNKIKFPESLKARIGSRVVTLSDLSKAQAVEVALQRLDETLDDDEPLIKKALIEKVFETSKKNPRLFLINLHRVFEEMHFEDADVVDIKHLRVLDDKLDEEDEEELDLALGVDVVRAEEQMTDERGNKILKIGDYYRCPDYDMFCGNCGAIVSENDATCPECAAEFEKVSDIKDDKGEANA